MQRTPEIDAHNTPDLTPNAAETVASGADLRRVTAGYDTGDQRQADPPPPDPPITEPPDNVDEAPLDTDTGMDFGAFGGRDAGSDIGSDALTGDL